MPNGREVNFVLSDSVALFELEGRFSSLSPRVAKIQHGLIYAIIINDQEIELSRLIYRLWKVKPRVFITSVGDILFPRTGRRGIECATLHGRKKGFLALSAREGGSFLSCCPKVRSSR
jgi:hypothetical protein